MTLPWFPMPPEPPPEIEAAPDWAEKHAQLELDEQISALESQWAKDAGFEQQACFECGEAFWMSVLGFRRLCWRCEKEEVA